MKIVHVILSEIKLWGVFFVFFLSALLIPRLAVFSPYFHPPVLHYNFLTMVLVLICFDGEPDLHKALKSAFYQTQAVTLPEQPDSSLLHNPTATH